MTSTSSLLISLALLFVGGWMVLWLGSSIIRPLLHVLGLVSKTASKTQTKFGAPSFGAPKGFTERLKFRRSARALQAVDRALAEEKIAAVCKLFPSALFFDWIQYSPELIAKSSHHHTELLNKLIIAAELKGGSIRNLPRLETLFGKRTDILTQAFETSLAKKRFSKKQQQKGKNPPKWSTKEFDTRLGQLKKELSALQSETKDELQKALSHIQAPSQSHSEDKRYH